MTKKHQPTFGQIIIVLALTGFMTCVAVADVQMIPFIVQSGGSGSGCPGAYTGLAKMTNSVGSFWFTPPTNATSGTLTDVSGFPSPYVSIAYVKRRSDLMPFCDTNSVTFPVTNTTTYSLTVYVKNQLPPPTNGEPMNLQITWQ